MSKQKFIWEINNPTREIVSSYSSNSFIQTEKFKVDLGTEPYWWENFILIFWKLLNGFICSYFQFYPNKGDHCSLYLATETELKSRYSSKVLKMKVSIKNQQNIKEISSMETQVNVDEPLQRLGWDDFMKTDEIANRSHFFAALTLVIDVSFSILVLFAC
jgi:hypothetical protein